MASKNPRADANGKAVDENGGITARHATSRRAFIRSIGAAAAGLPTLAATARSARAAEIGPLDANARRDEAHARRVGAARFQSGAPVPTLACNGDEARYASRIGNFTKTLPHDALGEVDRDAYDQFLRALESGERADFDRIPAGGDGRLANPRAANAFSLAGADSHVIDMPAVHALDSARQAAEAGEVYWMAVTRDVPFARYDKNRMVQRACEDLSRYADFTAPKDRGRVTPATVFRGQTPGDLVGPYVSQFLYLDVPYGDRANPQIALRPRRRDDYMTDFDSWLAVQRGQLPSSAVRLRKTPRYIVRGRDLGEYVHRDFSYQAYLNAALIALGFGGAALDPSPYARAAREGAFVTFGGAAILDLVARAGVVGLRPAWFHKWLVHRKLRPEAFGGRVHNHVTGRAQYPLAASFLDSPVLDTVFRRQGSYLLPQAFRKARRPIPRTPPATRRSPAPASPC